MQEAFLQLCAPLIEYSYVHIAVGVEVEVDSRFISPHLVRFQLPFGSIESGMIDNIKPSGSKSKRRSHHALKRDQRGSYTADKSNPSPPQNSLLLLLLLLLFFFYFHLLLLLFFSQLPPTRSLISSLRPPSCHSPRMSMSPRIPVSRQNYHSCARRALHPARQELWSKKLPRSWVWRHLRMD